MGFVILLIVGIMVGWLATIVLRVEDIRGTALNIAAAVSGAILAKLLLGTEPFFWAISPMTLVFAFAAAMILLVIANVVRHAASR